jgi:KaiC/GvpD/RAD55 family RecA-like ATPase
MPTAFRTRTIPSDKPLPQNLDAEKSVLGAILVDAKALKDAAEVVNSSDFFHPSNSDLSTNGRIFCAMLRLEKERKPIELVTLADHLHADGELAAYLASLATGVPRASNVKQYAKMVREKSLRRAMIYKTEELQRRAWDGGDPLEDLYSEFELFSKSALVARAGHKPTDLPEMTMMEMPPRTFILEPILPVKSIAMIYSWRGSGKTFFTLELTYSIASGAGNAFVWSIPEPRPVLYVDGEMDATELQERMRQIVIGHDGKMTAPGMMRFITPDLEDHTPEIITAEGRRRIEDQLKGGELLVLDNLSSLIPSGDERETEDWAMVQEWFLKLRRCGYTTLFCHHAGKGGGQRGTSNREDVLNLVINLRRPNDYSPEDGLRAEVHFEKIRGRASGSAVQPFEIRLSTDDRGGACWTRRPLKLLLEKQAYQMWQQGMKAREISEDLKITRFQVYRMIKRFDAGQLPAEETEE